MDEDISENAQNSNGSFEVESLQGSSEQIQFHMRQSLSMLKKDFTLTNKENFNLGSDQICLMQDMRIMGGGGSYCNNLHQVWQLDQNQIPNYWDHCSSGAPGFDSVHQPQYNMDGLSIFQNTSILGSFDPMIQYPPNSGPPLLKELLPGPASVFGGYEGDGGLVYNRQLEEVNVDVHGNRGLHLAMEIPTDSVAKQRGEKPGSEKERRTHMKERFEDLRNLIPNPTKIDKASILGDAIEYITQLVASVTTLQSLVEKKRSGVERTKRQRVDGNGSSCLKRKSKAAEVDVRIMDDEVTIKLVQRKKKKKNCLVLVSRVLDELQLDLHHVAGGHIGDHCSFLLNTKIYQGSSVYADAIANKLIEALDPSMDSGL